MSLFFFLPAFLSLVSLPFRLLLSLFDTFSERLSRGKRLETPTADTERSREERERKRERE